MIAKVNLSEDITFYAAEDGSFESPITFVLKWDRFQTIAAGDPDTDWFDEYLYSAWGFIYLYSPEEIDAGS